MGGGWWVASGLVRKGPSGDLGGLVYLGSVGSPAVGGCLDNLALEADEFGCEQIVHWRRRRRPQAGMDVDGDGKENTNQAFLKIRAVPRCKQSVVADEVARLPEGLVVGEGVHEQGDGTLANSFCEAGDRLCVWEVAHEPHLGDVQRTCDESFV